MWEACKLEQKKDGIAVLTLNRPEQLNALSEKMFYEIIAACGQIKEDREVRVLVITGAGRGFSAGGDISQMSAFSTPEEAKRIFQLSADAVNAVYSLEIPVIAAVNGAVAGASVALMLASDLVVAAENAVCGFSFLQVAFCPDSGCSHFLYHKVGYHKAFEILALGRILKSREALELGLFQRIVPDGHALDSALQVAEDLARGPLATIRMNKRLLRMAGQNSLSDQAKEEVRCQVTAWQSEDYREGTRAFLEKRRPEFKGK